VFQPYLEGWREEIGVVQRCCGDVDGRRPHGALIENLAAACAAELPDDALRGTVDAWMAREDFNLAAVERQPSNGRGGVCSSAGGTVANVGVDGFAGNAKPNCGTKAAALIYLHGLLPRSQRLGLRTMCCAILPRRRDCRHRRILKTMAEVLQVQCCIAGGGPAGMMLGFLLGRAGVKTLVLEKHADFLRDFRGDTVHPSTLMIMQELGLSADFLALPHSEIRALALEIGGASVKIADFARVPAPFKFVALMPQWDFLNFLADKGRRFPSLKVMMSAQVTDLVENEGRVAGVMAATLGGPLEVRADLVVGCDGRASTVREASGLVVEDIGAPIDVLWFRLSKRSGDPGQVLGRLGAGKMIVTIDRNDYWQCAYVIGKGGIGQIHAAGLEAFKAAVADGAHFLSDRVNELKSFDDIKLLNVSVDRLITWSKPGLLCIGDAAHAMSPVGGVGINLAIQDAVATANLLAAKLKMGGVRDDDLDLVRRRRLFPVKVIQAIQVAVHNRVLTPVVSGDAGEISVPWALKALNASAWLRRWPAQLLGLGVRPEHVNTPEAP
jgi:2-polyprenyl-6-methoxyphenol hydroxylase-like FAD-dependent oxidoreductase